MKLLRQLFMAVLFIALATACGGGSKNNSSSSNYFGSQSPGDAWDWTIGSTTWSAENTTLSLDYSGTYTTLPSGFLKLIVTASTDLDLTSDISAGDYPEAYALEYPDTMLLVAPPESDEGVIVATSQDSCLADGSYDYNWINIPHSSWTITDEAYGTATALFTNSGADVDFTITMNDITGASLGPSSSSLGHDCASGLITHPVDTSIFGIATSGVIIGDNGPGEGGVAGMLAPSSDIDLAALAAVEFRGVLFDSGGFDAWCDGYAGITEPTDETSCTTDGGTWYIEGDDSEPVGTEAYVAVGTEPTCAVGASCLRGYSFADVGCHGFSGMTEPTDSVSCIADGGTWFSQHGVETDDRTPDVCGSTFDQACGVMIEFTTQATPGVINANLYSLNDEGSDEQMVFTANVLGGKYVIFGFGAYLETHCDGYGGLTEPADATACASDGGVWVEDHESYTFALVEN
ncbi:hypothetical protein H8D30_00315 [bacterium]|nr:hypothetical protein [bacterium]